MHEKHYYEHILLSLFSLLLASGWDIRDLTRIVESALSRTRKTQKFAEPIPAGTTRVIGAIFYRWFRDPSYLDSAAMPRPLPLRGRRRSIEKLLREEGLTGKSIEEITRKLVKLRLLKKSRTLGYFPVSQVAVFQTISPELAQHIGLSLGRLMETVQYNTRPENRLEPLIERAASVIDLPEREVAAFRKFTRAQAQSFLTTIDDWLEARRIGRRSPTKGRRKCVSAGVHVYAFSAPAIDTRST